MKLKVLVACLFLIASNCVWSDGDHDHEEARLLRLNGEIVPLSQILMNAENEGLETILEVELEKENGQWIYEIEGLSKDNQLIELEYDARSGDMLSRESKKRKNKDHD